MGRVIRATLLLGFAALIARLFLTGDMAKYMSPTLDPLTGLAGAALAAMGLVELLHGADELARGDDVDDDELAEHVGHSGGEQVATVLLLLLPLTIGLFVPPRALGASALSGEDVTSTLLVYAPGPTAAAGTRPPTAPIEDVPDLLAYLSRAGQDGVGQRARVLGMALSGRALGPDELVLLRFSFAHCVADAQPLGLLVDASAVSPRTVSVVATGGWVEVEGTIAVRERGGDRFVTIDAERIALIEEPVSPYVRGF